MNGLLLFAGDASGRSTQSGNLFDLGLAGWRDVAALGRVAAETRTALRASRQRRDIVDFLGEVVGSALEPRRGVRAVEAGELCAEAQRLIAAWTDLDCVLEGQGLDLQLGLAAFARDLISYGRDVAPSLYGQLLSGEHQAALEALRLQVRMRADRATALAAAMRGFATRAGAFAAAFAAFERDPAVRISLREAPELCLAYDDDGVVMLEPVKGGAARQFWRLQLDQTADAHRLRSAADAALHLHITPDDKLWTLANASTPFGFPLVSEGPPPCVGALEGLPVGADLFRVPPRQGATLENVAFPGHALDVAEVQAGAPLRLWEKTGQSTQQWAFSPAPRTRREIALHDLVAPAADLATTVAGVRGLRGDWNAVLDDLEAGLSVADGGAPDLDAVLAGWERMADAAEAALAEFEAEAKAFDTAGS
ncbi:RICIN domain-containing protein [Caulobacter endophyticus]|uniref:RICIN domain-containing protein n=1 Tax=Caulobacter endophyticus TaxID=2172652 RepID=UPI00240FB3AB|nr:hypothetical protein [Caulobacter endophyticus]MDG2528004.1 hypothetical protein [Caulobacter endophyticus]